MLPADTPASSLDQRNIATAIKDENVISTPQFDEAELLTLIDRMLRTLPGGNGGKAKIRQVTQRQERYRGGYDAVATSVKPFYIQAKTSSFHSYKSSSEIISSRESIPLNTKPGVFTFYLRKHKGTDEPLQHNALYWLSLRSTAAYVCPTFVSENELDTRIDLAIVLKRHQVWEYLNNDYTDASTGKTQSFFTRHFNGLITIVPHRLVDHYLHRYSYDKSTTPSIVFHSDPESVGFAQPWNSFFNGLTNSSQSPDVTSENKVFQPVGIDTLRNIQLNWIDEAFDTEISGLMMKPSDVSQALHSANLSNSTNFDRSTSAINYLRKLDGLDLSAFFGSFLKEKYSIHQNILFQSE